MTRRAVLSVPVLSAPLHHLVLDFNGTLACDGRLLDGVAQRLAALATSLDIHVVTGDTFGQARQALAGLPCRVHVLAAERQSEAKQAYVQALGAASTACIGNGRNDLLMMQAAAVGIAVIQAEGASGPTVAAARVVCTSVLEALDLLLHPLRLTATLRT